MIITKEINQSKLMDELLKLNLITPIKPDGTSSLQGNELYVSDESKLTAINQIISSHVPTPVVMPDPDVELYNAINAATDIPTLKAALLGINGGKKAKIVGKLK